LTLLAAAVLDAAEHHQWQRQGSEIKMERSWMQHSCTGEA